MHLVFGNPSVRKCCALLRKGVDSKSDFDALQNSHAVSTDIDGCPKTSSEIIDLVQCYATIDERATFDPKKL